MSTQKRENKQDSQSSASSEKSVPVVASGSMIGDYQTAPKYMKDNEHITHGYRINFDSPKKIFKSLFMIHNESVNIWSHCVPAIIICIAIISFALIVDHAQVMKDMASYQQEVSSSFDHYLHALDNLTLIEEMKHMRDKTQNELQELRMNAISSFQKFTEKMNHNLQNLKETFEDGIEVLQESVRENTKENMEKFQKIKHDYQQIIAPALIDQLNAFNNSYIETIKSQIMAIKQQVDSDNFKYLDIVHPDLPNPHHVSRWPLLVFLSSALVCLLCSTLFHLFYPMSSKSYTIFSRFDYAGISILIAGSTFPPLYYSMYCYLEVAIIYEIIIMSLAISIFVLSVFEWMHRPQHAKFKAAIYGGFGLFNIFPISHLLINDFFFKQEGDGYTFASSVPYYLLLGASYLIGLYIYTIRCPERHYPGKFNLCGHSHQIWHMFVVLGIVFTYFGAIQNFEMRKNNACPVPTL